MLESHHMMESPQKISMQNKEEKSSYDGISSSKTINDALLSYDDFP